MNPVHRVGGTHSQGDLELSCFERNKIVKTHQFLYLANRICGYELLLSQKLHTVSLKRQKLRFLLPRVLLNVLIIQLALPQLIKVAERMQVRLLLTALISLADMNDSALDQILSCIVDKRFTYTTAFCNRCFAREAAAFFIVALLQEAEEHERMRTRFSYSLVTLRKMPKTISNCLRVFSASAVLPKGAQTAHMWQTDGIFICSFARRWHSTKSSMIVIWCSKKDSGAFGTRALRVYRQRFWFNFWNSCINTIHRITCSDDIVCHSIFHIFSCECACCMGTT